ncbi:hypothetical protein HK096_006742, partial [Nowakowskiella sp. JEL0078]
MIASPTLPATLQSEPSYPTSPDTTNWTPLAKLPPSLTPSTFEPNLPSSPEYINSALVLTAHESQRYGEIATHSAVVENTDTDPDELMDDLELGESVVTTSHSVEGEGSGETILALSVRDLFGTLNEKVGENTSEKRFTGFQNRSVMQKRLVDIEKPQKSALAAADGKRKLRKYQIPRFFTPAQRNQRPPMVADIDLDLETSLMTLRTLFVDKGGEPLNLTRKEFVSVTVTCGISQYLNTTFFNKLYAIQNSDKSQKIKSKSLFSLSEPTVEWSTFSRTWRLLRSWFSPSDDVSLAFGVLLLNT